MKLKRLIATAGLAAVLAIGVGTGITMNRGMERADAALTYQPVTSLAGLDTAKTYVLGNLDSQGNPHMFNGTLSSKALQQSAVEADWKLLNVEKTATTFALSFGEGAAKKYVAYSGSSTGASLNKDAYNFSFIDGKNGLIEGGGRFLGSSSNKLSQMKFYAKTNIDSYPHAYLYEYSAAAPTVRDYNISSKNVVLDINGTANVNLTLNSVFTSATKVTWAVATGSEEFVSITQTGNNVAIKGLKETKSAKVTVTITDGTDYTKTETVAVTVNDPNKIYTVTDAVTNAPKGTVRVSGIVGGKNGNNMYIIDPTNGKGIAAYKIDKKDTMNVGDEVVVSGTLGAFKGMAQIQDGILIETKTTGNTIDIPTVTLEQITDATKQDYVILEPLTFKSITSPDPKKDDKLVTFTNGKHDASIFIKGFQLSERLSPAMIARLEASKDAGIKVTLRGISMGANGSGNVTLQSLDVIETAYGKDQFGLSINANVWANAFVDALTKECGTTYVLSEATWNAQATEYAKLDAADKEAFKTVAADQNGKPAQKAVSSHNYVVTKYSFTNFIGVANLVAQNNNAIVNNSNMIITIVAISTIAVSAIALLVIFKRRRATR